jgi:hypothetical protein
MVPRNPTGGDCCLVDQIRIEVGVAKTGLRRVECRVGQVDSTFLDKGCCVDPVMCSARNQNSARLRYLVTSRVGRGSPDPVRGAARLAK